MKDELWSVREPFNHAEFCRFVTEAKEQRARADAAEATCAALRAAVQRASDFTGINAQAYYERYGTLDEDPHEFLADILARTAPEEVPGDA